MWKKIGAAVSGVALACTLAIAGSGAASASTIPATQGNISTAIGQGIIKTDGPSNYTQTQKVSGPTLTTKKFVRYLTSAWAPANNYTWGTTTTVNASLSASIGVSASSVSSTLGVTASATQSWSVSVSIPASSSRLSKLALLSDYNVYGVRSRQVWMGVPTAWKSANLYSPRRGYQYLAVRYQ